MRGNPSPEPSLREIFLEALDRADPQERADYLDTACGGDARLRGQVEGLLQNDREDSFLERPAVAASAGVIPRSGPPAEGPGRVIGRYKLLQELGEGGCGVVYMAEQEEPVRRRVAVKVIKLGMDTKQVVARFNAERQALAMMDHPNIAKVLDAGSTETGRPYFVMELVRGIKITEYCDQNLVSPRERLDLFIKVCQAIQHAHQKGIIHRDIKPSNILVTLHDGVPVPKVIDFGIAKATEGRLTDQTLFTAFEQFLGTPAYMSPEQAEMSGLDIDTRSDIYALGVLLYELLVGRTPFDARALLAAGADEMRRTIREKEPVRPSTCISNLGGEDQATAAKRRGVDLPKLIHLVRGDLDWIVMKCLEKDRTRRYPTANALAMDIQRHLSNETVLARPPSTSYRVQRLVRRNKLAFGAAAAVACALVLGTVVSVWEARRANAARGVAEEQKRVAEKQEKIAKGASNRATEERNKAKAAQASEAQQRLLAEAESYTADMNVVLEAWQQGNLKRARDLLSAHVPKGSRDLRGFEWRYLWRLCQDESKYSYTNAPDQNVWRLATSPQHGLVAGIGGEFIRLFQGTTGQESSRIHLRDVRLDNRWSKIATCRADTNLVATGVDGGRAVLWDLRTQTKRMDFHPHGASLIAALALSSDGKSLVTAPAHGNELILWDVSSRAPQPQGRWTNHTDTWVDVLCFSPDNQTLVSNGKSYADSTLVAWEASTGKELRPFPKTSTGYLRAVAFSPDGRLLAASGVQNRINVWDFTNRTVAFYFDGHIGPVNTLEFSPEGSRLISGGEDGTIRLWDIQRRQAIGKFRDPLGRVIESAIFSPDGKAILSVAADQVNFAPGAEPGVSTELKVWSTEPCEAWAALRETHQDWASVAISPDGQWLVTSEFVPVPSSLAATNRIKVWSMASREQKLFLDSPTNRLHGGVFSPDGKLFAIGSDDGLACLWKTQEWEGTQTGLAPYEVVTNDYASTLAFSAEGKILAVAGESFLPDHPQHPAVNHLVFWDVGLRQKRKILAGATAGGAGELIPTAVAFSHNVPLLGIGYRNGTVRLYDFNAQELLCEARHTSVGAFGITSLSFSDDGLWLASSSLNSVLLWEISDLKHPPVPVEMKVSPGTWQAGFVPLSQTLVTSGNDGRIRFWNLETHKEALTLWHSDGPGGRFGFTRDSNLLVSADAQGTLKFWPAAPVEDIPKPRAADPTVK